MKRLARSMLLAVIVSATTALSVWAGGWAVITLDKVPDQIAAGQAFTIGFTVRQHGRTLRDDLTPLLRFDRADLKDSFVVTAKRSGESGHYVADVTVPSAGQWNWKVDIEQFGMVTQDMAPLTVVAAPVVAPSSAVEPAPAPADAPSAKTTVPVAAATNTMPLVAGAAGVIVALGALLLWLRTRARLALVVVAVAGLIGVIGFTTAGTSVAQPVAADKSASLDQPLAVDKTSSVATTDQVAMGRALFSDKGCVMCHAHPEVKTEYGPFWMGDEPPNLSSGKYTAAYLQQWLKDPSKVKPKTEMPNLHLSDAEIAALSAFLGAK